MAASLHLRCVNLDPVGQQSSEGQLDRLNLQRLVGQCSMAVEHSNSKDGTGEGPKPLQVLVQMGATPWLSLQAPGWRLNSCWQSGNAALPPSLQRV
jgi:hypothetical protein